MKAKVALTSLFLCSVVLGQTTRPASRPVVALHEATIYPVIRVLCGAGGGSGTILYSEDRDKKGTFASYALTNHHVINDAVKVEKRWSSLLNAYVDTETRQTVKAEVFRYERTSKQVGRESFDADIIAHSKDHDLAILKLRCDRRIPYVARIRPKELADQAYLFDKTYAVGCSLLHAPLATSGEITSLNDEIENKSFWLSSSAIIFGNCIMKDSLISMSNGSVRKIQDVCAGDIVWSCGPKTLSTNVVLAGIQSGVKPCLEVKTGSHCCRVSSDHPLLTIVSVKSWDKSNILIPVWKDAGSLEPGDLLGVMRELPSRSRASGFNLAPIIGQDTDRHKFLDLCGFFLGDGWIRDVAGKKHEFSLATYADGDWQHYSSILRELFGLIPQPHARPNVVTVSSKLLLGIMKTCGFSGTSTTKEIPDWLMTLPKDQQESFIGGYLKADGHVTGDNRHVFEANNEWLIKKLRMMCIHQGISACNLSSRLRKPADFGKGKLVSPTSPSWAFTATPSRKNSRNSWYCRENGRLIRGDRRFIPDHLVFEAIRKITSIGEQEVFDLNIKGVHNYFADGVLVHNSGGAVFRQDTLEFIGVPSRVPVYGFGNAVTHMAYFIDLPRIYSWLEDEHLMFIYTAKTPDDCMKEREVLQRAAQFQRVSKDAERQAPAGTPQDK